MSVRRHEQQTRTSDSGHGVLGVWLPFCGAGSVETYGGGILVVVEGDAAIPGVFGPQRGVPPGWVPCFCWLKQEEDEEEPTTVQKHAAHFEKRPPDAIFFPGPNGGPVSLRTVYTVFRQLLLQCGIPHAG